MKKPIMPSYYGKNIAQHAQRRFFQRKQRERERRTEEARADRALCEAEQRGTASGRGEVDHL